MSWRGFVIHFQRNAIPAAGLRPLAAIPWTSRARGTYLIDQLEQSELVRREEVASDRGGVRAVLTARGLATVHVVAPLHVDVQ